MPLESLTCPNCGAPAQIEPDDTTSVCTFCGSKLRVASEKPSQWLEQLSESNSSATSMPWDAKQQVVDVESIKQLLIAGKKIEAIKAYREQTGLGLAEAKAAVEAIERRFLIRPPAAGGYVPSARARRNGFVGCLSVLGSIVACAGLIGVMSQLMFRVFGPLDQALEMMRTNSRVVEAFGTPINPGFFVFGEISSGSVSSHAQFEVPVFGPRRSGYLRTIGSWDRGGWDLSLWVVYDENGEEVEIHIESGG